MKTFSFFCGLHFLLSFADQTEASLKACHWLLYDDRPVDSLANGGYSKGESATSQLIRTTCKAVLTHRCEKSGRIYTFLCEAFGFFNVLFIPFKGNQFNLLLYNGGIHYFLYT